MPQRLARIFDRAKAIFTPSLPDLFLAVVLLGAFGRVASWHGLLADGDTGWHIRTGELILSSGSVPARDPFSFSRPGEPWLAWEWLADVALALSYRWHGLAAVAALAATVIALIGVVLFGWLLRRGAGLWISAGVSFAVLSASSVHSLARPHVFSMLGFAIALWMLDEDRRRPAPWVWSLVPLAALWANLHGGFVAWLATLGFLVLVRTAERNWPAARRYGALLALSAAATLLNPYGWRLHQHIVSFLGSSWILENVGEFRAPSFRTENTLVFAGLLLAGAALASRAFARRQWFEGGLVLVWGLAALRSVRHIPLYAIVAAPVVATECARCWRDWAARSRPRSAARVFWDLGQEVGRSWRPSLWAPVLGGLALWALVPARLADFPETKFPVAAVARNADRLVSRPALPRILTSDQWGDYLIFRLYPRQRVFFDGRSDFYGPAVGSDYQVLRAAGPRWPEMMARYRFDAALLPIEWPLGRVLEQDPEWEVVYRDSVAQLMTRRPPPFKKDCGPPIGRE